MRLRALAFVDRPV